jgi:hypothetical protein
VHVIIDPLGTNRSSKTQHSPSILSRFLPLRIHVGIIIIIIIIIHKLHLDKLSEPRKRKGFQLQLS